MDSDGNEENSTPQRTARRPALHSSVPTPPLLQTLEDARQVRDGIAILQGRGGQQTYIVCPAVLVRCWEPVLKLLLADLDAIVCPGNSGGVHVRYERLPVGTVLPGGGEVLAGVWMHARLVELELGRPVRGVLKGRLGRLPLRYRLHYAVRNSLRQLQPR